MDVLIVDDDDEIRGLVSEILADEGFFVREAVHGRHAMELLGDASSPLPSVILLDLMMPVMNGLELLDQMAASDRLRGIPVIITTAAPDKAAGREGNAVVVKPYSVGALLEQIRRHVGEATPG